MTAPFGGEQQPGYHQPWQAGQPMLQQYQYPPPPPSYPPPQRPDSGPIPLMLSITFLVTVLVTAGVIVILSINHYWLLRATIGGGLIELGMLWLAIVTVVKAKRRRRYLGLAIAMLVIVSILILALSLLGVIGLGMCGMSIIFSEGGIIC